MRWLSWHVKVPFYISAFKGTSVVSFVMSEFSMLDKMSAEKILKCFPDFVFQKMGFDLSCKLSPYFSQTERFCRFPLPLGVWEGLRFVIVALPGVF